MELMEKGSRFRFSSPLLSGLLASCLTMLIITILSSLIIWMSSAEESSLGTYSFLNYLISMFIGGWTAGKKAGRKGWYYGLLLSGVYCILMWIIGFLALNIHLSLRSFIMLACCMLAGCIGGMLGVNTKK